jgi:hypothetical protein
MFEIGGLRLKIIIHRRLDVGFNFGSWENPRKNRTDSLLAEIL